MQPKEFDDVPQFFQQFVLPGKFSKASILMVGEARKLMNLYGKLNIALVPKEKRKKLTRGEKLKIMLQSITNDSLKSLVFEDELNQEGVNNLSEFKNTFGPFKSYSKLPSTIIAYNKALGQFNPDTAYIGKLSYNFSLPDTAGHTVSMKDFKGKVIFIDVWATWCGPCKEQIPYLKEIEEEYKDNKDIVFVGISIDRLSDRGKWVKMIQKENMGGIQLLDDLGKTFSKPYKIDAIPRFLLIDKQGNWIEIRCPRPSDKEALKVYLDDALVEKV
jgi:thiol-disulfide isomerase/thioredoxin